MTHSCAHTQRCKSRRAPAKKRAINTTKLSPSLTCAHLMISKGAPSPSSSRRLATPCRATFWPKATSKQMGPAQTKKMTKYRSISGNTKTGSLIGPISACSSTCKLSKLKIKLWERASLMHNCYKLLVHQPRTKAGKIRDRVARRLECTSRILTSVRRGENLQSHEAANFQIRQQPRVTWLNRRNKQQGWASSPPIARPTAP
mmetsp:Transcript_13690/g.17302  ORF Transcript_13690/g.17302 Transcript_13690/m.17302 type:complete len:202 (+) Transcript_13690:1677-2282(+)